jgi:hypothetical protein
MQQENERLLTMKSMVFWEGERERLSVVYRRLALGRHRGCQTMLFIDMTATEEEKDAKEMPRRKAKVGVRARQGSACNPAEDEGEEEE